MCGIGGIVNLNQQPISIDLVKGLSDDIHHRGPDDEGYLFTGPTTGDISKLRNAIVKPLKQLPFPLTFCHRRLAIIDLSPNGRQPMANNNEFLWITYNGELYNYLELRDSLKNDYHFKTDTDTEVILAAYEVWGKDCVNKFNGMWSFAILDTRSNEIFASRDRFGIKPFYYTKTANSFAFGSEIKQLLRFTTRSIHSETVSQFVTYGDINTSEQTCFEDIFQLMPGHCLTLNLDTSKALKVYPFYDLKEKVSPQKNTTSFQEVVEEFDHLFQDSIQLRLRSDVEVGACLSGGLDSSSIVAYSSALSSRKLQTFTSCFEDKRFDEWVFAQKVVESSKARAHQIFANLEGLEEELDHLIWHQDEPFRTSSTYAQWCVMKSAKDHGVKVLLDGQGADEALSGYHWYIPVLLGELSRKGHWRKALQLSKHLKDTGVLTATESFGRTLGKTIYMSLNIFNRDARSKNKFLSQQNQFIRKIGYETSVIGNQIQDLSLNLSSLLRYEDRNSMAFSIESRTPFLDYRLVEFLLNLPLPIRFHGGWTKSVLRSSVQHKLPPEVVWRVDKKGFVTPQQVFLNRLYQKSFKDVFSSPHLERWFNMKEIKNGFQHRQLPESLFWKAYSIDRWVQKFNLG